MAKYQSLFTIRGTIDGLTFRKTAEGKIVSAKTGPTREQVLTNERFALTRRNASEFKQTIQSATLFRRALHGVLDGLRSTTLNGHVNGLLHTLTRSDTTNDFGQRCASDGDISTLIGFDFNRQLRLSPAPTLNISHSLDAQLKTAALSVAPGKSFKRFAAGTDATHFRFVCGLVAIDFASRQFSRDLSLGELLPLHRKSPSTLSFSNQVAAVAGQALIHVCGIQLFRTTPAGPVLVRGGAVQIIDAAWAPEPATAVVECTTPPAAIACNSNTGNDQPVAIVATHQHFGVTQDFSLADLVDAVIPFEKKCVDPVAVAKGATCISASSGRHNDNRRTRHRMAADYARGHIAASITPAKLLAEPDLLTT